MKLDVVELDKGITKVVMSGRMDVDGSQAIDIPFSAIAGSKSKLILDMSDVSFLASLGMRTLVSGAKAVNRRGGAMVILSPQANVAKVLKSSGIDSIIPIADDLAAAMTRVGG